MFVKEQLASFIGTAVHNYFELCLGKYEAPGKYRMEERLFHTVLNRKISGCYDLVREENLNEDMYDYKTTSCWKARFGSKDDWIAQQNIYRLLFWLKHKRTLRTIRIVAIFLDWSINNKIRYGKGYPDDKVLEYTLPVWSSKKTLAFMKDKVRVLIDHENTPDDDLPECTTEDMWADDDVYAVKSTRLVNALRLLPTRDAAYEWVDKHMESPNCKDKLSQITVEHRPANRKRCEHWCAVNKYCSQYKAYLKTKAKKKKGKK
jgi:hypothetical protein